MLAFGIRLALCTVLAVALLCQLLGPQGTDASVSSAASSSLASPLVSALPLLEVSVEHEPTLHAKTLPVARINAEDVARAVGRQNPSLSLNERQRIGDAVLRYSAKYKLQPSLVAAVLLVESGSRPWVVSNKGAVGLMQVMPYMFEALPIAGNLNAIETNIEAGCWILADNIRRLGEKDGVSAYFWGSNIRGVAYQERVYQRRDEIHRSVGS